MKNFSGFLCVLFLVTGTLCAQQKSWQEASEEDIERLQTIFGLSESEVRRLALRPSPPSTADMDKLKKTMESFLHAWHVERDEARFWSFFAEDAPMLAYTFENTRGHRQENRTNTFSWIFPTGTSREIPIFLSTSRALDRDVVDGVPRCLNKVAEDNFCIVNPKLLLWQTIVHSRLRRQFPMEDFVIVSYEACYVKNKENTCWPKQLVWTKRVNAWKIFE